MICKSLQDLVAGKRDVGQREQTSSYKMRRFGELMYSLVITVNNTVLYPYKLLTVHLKYSQHKEVIMSCDEGVSSHSVVIPL